MRMLRLQSNPGSTRWKPHRPDEPNDSKQAESRWPAKLCGKQWCQGHREHGASIEAPIQDGHGSPPLLCRNPPASGNYCLQPCSMLLAPKSQQLAPAWQSLESHSSVVAMTFCTSPLSSMRSQSPSSSFCCKIPCICCSPYSARNMLPRAHVQQS